MPRKKGLFLFKVIVSQVKFEEVDAVLNMTVLCSV